MSEIKIWWISPRGFANEGYYAYSIPEETRSRIGDDVSSVMFPVTPVWLSEEKNLDYGLKYRNFKRENDSLIETALEFVSHFGS